MACLSGRVITFTITIHIIILSTINLTQHRKELTIEQIGIINFLCLNDKLHIIPYR